jgi:quercetin dioxygenase-like cupin family protein
MRRALFLAAALVCLAVSSAKAQDPVKVDPNNWKVEFENDQVRVLRVKIGPHGKLGMHEHPANVLITLTDGHVKDIFPDGKTAEREFKAGQATWRDAVKHANENLTDKPTESFLVEVKAKPAATKAPAAKKKG